MVGDDDVEVGRNGEEKKGSIFSVAFAFSGYSYV